VIAPPPPWPGSPPSPWGRGGSLGVQGGQDPGQDPGHPPSPSPRGGQGRVLGVTLGSRRGVLGTWVGSAKTWFLGKWPKMAKNGPKTGVLGGTPKNGRKKAMSVLCYSKFSRKCKKSVFDKGEGGVKMGYFWPFLAIFSHFPRKWGFTPFWACGAENPPGTR
jgi:hypothetical protein